MIENTLNTNRGEGLNFPFEAGTVKIFTREASVELYPNGDIHVNGKKAANDQEVVDGFRFSLSRLRKEEDRDSKKETVQTLLTVIQEAGWDADGEESAGDFVKRLARIVTSKLEARRKHNPDWAFSECLILNGC